MNDAEITIRIEDGVNWERKGDVVVAVWRGYSCCGSTEKQAIRNLKKYVKEQLAEDDI